MIAGYPEEGDRCPDRCGGTLSFVRDLPCSCHIHPPCSACVDAPLTCGKCGWTDDEQPSYSYVQVAPGLAQREYKPRALSETTIDWRTKPHTHFTQIHEGVYPEGTTREQVLEKVKGTFGGRFEYFSNGRFKYIAYTD